VTTRSLVGLVRPSGGGGRRSGRCRSWLRSLRLPVNFRSDDASDLGRDPRTLPALLRGARARSHAVRLPGSPGRPDPAVHGRGDEPVQGHVPRQGGPPAQAGHDRAEVPSCSRPRQRRPHPAASHVLRDARPLLVRRLLQEGVHRLGVGVLHRGARHPTRAARRHDLSTTTRRRSRSGLKDIGLRAREGVSASARRRTSGPPKRRARGRTVRAARARRSTSTTRRASPIRRRRGWSSSPSDRFTEIGNCVFTQFDRQADGTLARCRSATSTSGSVSSASTAVLAGREEQLRDRPVPPLHRADRAVRRQALRRGSRADDVRHPSDRRPRARAVVFCIADGALPGQRGPGLRRAQDPPPRGARTATSSA
jgi:hypothetical protein